MLALAGCGKADGTVGATQTGFDVGTLTYDPPGDTGPTLYGANVQGQIAVEGRLPPHPSAQLRTGAHAFEQSGCFACHALGANGNSGPGPKLDDIAQRLPPMAIARSLTHPTAPMPSFAQLQRTEPERFRALVAFLAVQKG